jgi:uncharacterized membrane protein YphA (DoxX/SURF4 family)
MTRKLAISLRILLGAVFIYAAYTKLRESWLVFAMSIDAYQLLPSWAVFTVARTLPWVELILGLLLVTGRFMRYTAPAVTVVLIGFYAAMLRAYHFGTGIDCGCFGVGEAVSAITLTRDGILLGSSLIVTFLTFNPEGLRRNQVGALTHKTNVSGW